MWIPDPDQQVQLPITNDCETIVSKSIAWPVVLLDTQKWMEGEGLALVSISNSEILIDNTSNQGLITLFSEILSSHTEVED